MYVIARGVAEGESGTQRATCTCRAEDPARRQGPGRGVGEGACLEAEESGHRAEGPGVQRPKEMEETRGDFLSASLFSASGCQPG